MVMIPKTFTGATSMREKILLVLSVMQKGSGGEVALEIIELQGIAPEAAEGSATIDIEQELKKMLDEGLQAAVKEQGQRKRYALPGEKK